MWAFPHLLPCWELPRALHGSQEPARGAVGIPGIPEVVCPVPCGQQGSCEQWQLCTHAGGSAGSVPGTALASLPALLGQLSWAQGDIKQPGWPTRSLQEQWQSWHVLASRFSSFNINNANTPGHLYLQIGIQGTKRR